jgi:DNA polymerase-3 subunit epsilon
VRLVRRGGGQAFREGAAFSAQTPWRQADWCAVDLELTGLDPREDEIIAIGAVPIREGRVILGQSYYTLVQSGRAPRRAAVLIHKLRTADLAKAPLPPEAIDGLLTVMAGTVPVFHTAWVEEAFLGRALRKRHVQLPAGADTEVLGRRWMSARAADVEPHLGLSQLSQLLGLPAESPHHALGDALTTAKAFIALASLLDAAEPQTVGSLVAGTG